MLIPVFNERQNLPTLLSAIEDKSASLLRSATATSLKLLLLDDGSTDGTPEVAEATPVSFSLQVVRSSRNCGPGNAFANGFAHLGKHLQSQDLVITLEGDNTSRLETACRMLVRLREGYDAVLASPYAYGGGFRHTSWHRIILSHGANALLKSAVGIHGIHTMSSFFRVMRGSLLTELQAAFGERVVERTGFECMAELLIKMILLGATISEVEMVLDSSRRAGRSKMRLVPTIRGYLALVPLRLRLARQVQRRMGTYDLRPS
jgi:dolichol-phosphate mannosyltransferase